MQVNAVGPGGVIMTRQRNVRLAPEAEQAQLEGLVSRRRIEPGDGAGVVVLLASDGARDRAIVGWPVVVDGAWT